ncbi:MAG: HD domain-containing protein [Desulfurococcales archaeon]|nr:HD domain-containing protein [Desulfurococcales archaeon]
MVHVSPYLIERHISRSPLLRRAWELLTSDPEVQSLLRMANVNAVERLLYNDHGPVHAQIVAGTALELFDMLYRHGLRPSSIIHKTVPTLDCARLIVLLGAYLHDIGNSVHRDNHELIGAILSGSILDRLLPNIVSLCREQCDQYKVRSEVQQAIYATSMSVTALTLEASIVKVADSLDMAEGRARLPYSKGKMDIHALSALSIKRVEITNGESRPVQIRVQMEDKAGMFQIEKVLLPKIKTSIIQDYIEIVPILLDDNSISLSTIYP